MRIAAETGRAILVSAPPQAVAQYFSRNEALLSRLVGQGRVSRIDDGLYRVALRTFEALGLAVRPVLAVQFTDTPEQTTMEALEVRAVEGPAGLALDVAFAGVARFDPHPEGCRVDCTAQATIDLGLPFPFSLLPERLLEAAAMAVLSAAMEATTGRFEALLLEDFSILQQKAA